VTGGHHTSMVRSMSELIEEHVPEAATLLVASSGGQDLVSFGGRHLLAFPADVPGVRVPDPLSGIALIAHLEVQRAWGAQFLLIPATELWRLDEDRAFERHLSRHYHVVLDDGGYVLFSLRRERSGRTTTAELVRRTVIECEQELRRPPTVLDWFSGLDFSDRLPDLRVFSPLEQRSDLPYLTHTIDLVVLPVSAGSAALAEADRVAALAVVSLPETSAFDSDEAARAVRWKSRSVAPGSTTSVITRCSPASRATDAFLFSLRETLAESDAEILIVTDTEASGGAELAAWRAADERVHLVDVAAEASLGQAWNAAASVAEGELLVFLLSAVALLPEWLPPLQRLFRDRESAGGAAAKILTCDGELLHAGGDVLPDGSIDARRGGRPDAPGLASVRAVGFGSPLLVATPRRVFGSVGGFAADHPSVLSIDYCLRLREKGYDVFFQPETVAVLLDRDTSVVAASNGS
jgi:hypothetical protein